jgi:hypothetical protein
MVLPVDPRAATVGPPSSAAGPDELTACGARPTHLRQVVVFLAASIVLHCVVTLWLGPMIFNDSVRYTALGPWHPAIDVLGVDGTGSPFVQLVWLLPIPLALVAQSILGGLVWAFATIAGLVVIPSRRVAIGWLAVFTLMYWQPRVLLLDAAIASESLTISGSLACVTGSVCVSNARARQAVPLPVVCIAMVGGFGVAVLSRPVTLIALAPIMFVAFLLAWRDGCRRPLLVLCAFAITAYGVLLSANVAHSSSEVLRAQDRLALRATPEMIAAAHQTGFTDCPELTSDQLIKSARDAYHWYPIGPLQIRRPGDEKPPTDAVYNTQCSGISNWVKARHLTPVEQLVYIPGDAVSGYISDVFNLWLEHAFSPDPIRFGPIFTVLFDLAALTTLGVSAWRRQGPARVWILVGTAFLSWFAYSIAVWLSDPVELGRHFLPIPVVLAPFAFSAALFLWPERDSDTI